RLAHAVGGRNQIAVHDGHLQTSGMATRDQRLMEVRQARHHCAAGCSAAHHQHSHAPSQQIGMNAVCFHSSAALYKLQQCLVRLGQESDWESSLTILQALPQSKEALGMTREPHGSVWVGKLAPEETGFPAGH